MDAPTQKAAELVQSFLNGNLTTVRDELDVMPQSYALAVVARMMDEFAGIEASRPPSSSGKPYAPYYTDSFLRLLEVRL